MEKVGNWLTGGNAGTRHSDDVAALAGLNVFDDAIQIHLGEDAGLAARTIVLQAEGQLL